MNVIVPIGNFGYLLWQLLQSISLGFRDRKRIAYQLEQVGVHSIPLVLLIGFFAGAIIAWQGAYQFKGMVSLSVLGGQVVRVVMMEMAPIMTALVISGRIGASMTAEIGSMKVSEQIDALRTMSLDPIRYIVMPRFLGLSLMMPVLTVFALAISVVGAWVVSSYFLAITPQVFFGSVRDFFQLGDLVGGLIKSVIFGMMIASIACYKGLYAQGGAKGVGKATISSFVLSAIAILAGDFMLWIILF
ncbi:MAG: ABC transporter permease [Bacteroidetes bacterium]|nr:MAG: ABC transporter permease [Bacteroidota bacterium]